MMKKKLEKELPQKTQFLIVFIMMFLAVCMFLGFMWNGIADYHRSNLTYDDFEYKEYIFEDCKRVEDPEMGSSNLIYVQGETKPLKINNLLSTRQLEEKLDRLKKGGSNLLLHQCRIRCLPCCRNRNR